MEFNFSPLYTNKGSKIWYSKYGIGKQIGSKIYVCREEATRIVPIQIWEKAKKILMEKSYNILNFNTICYDLKQPYIVRFDTCESFYTENEPVIGMMIYIDVENIAVKEKYNPQIYHGKWMWVSKEFKGFDVYESWQRSKEYYLKLNEIPSGYKEKWNKQLKKINMK